MIDNLKYWDLIEKSPFKNRVSKREVDEGCNYANELYLKVLNDYNLKVLDYSYSIVNSGRRAGYFKIKNNEPLCIRINVVYLIFLSKQNYLKKIRRTVLHEIAHYIQFVKFGFTDHSVIFNAILSELLRKYPKIKNIELLLQKVSKNE